MALALLSALLIGITLGLLGSGGSILTVPVLIFILQRPEKLAIAESLAIVGSIALLGAIPYAMRAHIHWRSVLLLGIPGMLGASAGGWCSYFISGPIQMMIFSLVMIIVAGMMLFGNITFENMIPHEQSIGIILIEGFLMGFLTGIIGVGGGFIIIPTLLIISHLSMSIAVGTSLVIIAINSFTGFIQQILSLHLLHFYVDWEIIFIISIAGIFGSFFGSFIGKKISQYYLRKAFGFSVLVLGIYILLSQLNSGLLLHSLPSMFYHDF